MLIDVFRGEHLYLSAPRDSDKPILERWYNDSQFLRLLDTEIAYPPYAYDMLPNKQGTLFEFRLRLLTTDELIGFTAIHSVEWNNGIGTFSIGIGSAAHRGNGYGSEALALTLRYAFCELNLHRVGLEVIAYNAAARFVYERAGFVTEGVLRQCVYRDGKRYDKLVMGLLRDEWLTANDVH